MIINSIEVNKSNVDQFSREQLQDFGETIFSSLAGNNSKVLSKEIWEQGKMLDFITTQLVIKQPKVMVYSKRRFDRNIDKSWNLAWREGDDAKKQQINAALVNFQEVWQSLRKPDNKNLRIQELQEVYQDLANKFKDLDGVEIVPVDDELHELEKEKGNYLPANRSAIIKFNAEPEFYFLPIGEYEYGLKPTNKIDYLLNAKDLEIYKETLDDLISAIKKLNRLLKSRKKEVQQKKNHFDFFSFIS